MAELIKWHKPPLFEVCFFGFCPDVTVWDKVRAQVERECILDIKDYPDTQGMLTCWHDKFGNARGLVTLNEELDTNPVKIVGTICHESVHVVEMILDAAAEGNPGEETRAYLTEAVATTIWTDYVMTRGNPKYQK